MGFSLRLDALPRDSNRNDRCGRGWIRSLFGRSRSGSRRRQILDRSQTCLWQLRDLAFDSAVGWRAFNRAADVHEHARIEAGQTRSEYFHDREAGSVVWSDCAGNFRGVELGSRARELWQSLVGARNTRRFRRRLDGGHRIRIVRRSLRSTNRLVVLGRCVEQHHFHRGRGKGSETKYSFVAGIRHDDRDRIVSTCQRRLPDDVAV